MQRLELLHHILVLTEFLTLFFWGDVFSLSLSLPLFYPLHFENVVPQQACSPMAKALNAMESNLETLSSASEPDSYTKSQADAKFEAVDTQLEAKATKSDLTAHIAAVDTQFADLQLATDAVAELKTLFADFKASTDEKMNDLEAQLQERKRKRADQDAKNNIAATAANNDDNGETSVGDNTNTNTDNDNETSASSAGIIAAITVPLLLVAVIVIGVLVHRNQKLSQNQAPRGKTRPRRASRARPSGRQPRQPRQQQQQFGGIQDPQEPYDSSFVSSSMRAVSNPTSGEAGELVHQNPAFDQNANENAYVQASAEQSAMYDRGEVSGLHEGEENYESVDGEDSDDYQC